MTTAAKTSNADAPKFVDLKKEIFDCLQQAQSSALAHRSRELEKLLWQYLEKKIRLGYRQFSFDVFDTVLIRNQKSEPTRFYEISQQLAGITNRKEMNELYLRLYWMKISYTHCMAWQGSREGNLKDIASARSLVERNDIRDRLLAVEEAYEIDNTELSKAVSKSCERLMNAGCDLVLITDMYLPADLVRSTLRAKTKIFEAVPIISSAEVKSTKSNGMSYEYVKNKFNYVPRTWVHVGDNFKSDIFAANSKGISTLHLPIPEQERRARDMDRDQLLAKTLMADLMDLVVVS